MGDILQLSVEFINIIVSSVMKAYFSERTFAKPKALFCTTLSGLLWIALYILAYVPCLDVWKENIKLLIEEVLLWMRVSLHDRRCKEDFCTAQMLHLILEIKLICAPLTGENPCGRSQCTPGVDLEYFSFPPTNMHPKRIGGHTDCNKRLACIFADS